MLQRVDLTGRPGEQHFSPPLQLFLGQPVAIPHLALHIFGSAQQLQRLRRFGHNMADMQILVHGSAEYRAALAQRLLRQQRKNAAGGAFCSQFIVDGKSRIDFALPLGSDPLVLRAQLFA